MDNEAVNKWCDILTRAMRHQLNEKSEFYESLVLDEKCHIDQNTNKPTMVLFDKETGKYIRITYNMVGFSGKAGSGKDFCADIYERILTEVCTDDDFSPGKSYWVLQRDAFANTLKELCSTLTDTDIDKFQTQSGKEERNILVDMTNRKLAQLVGTECFRDVLGEDIWVITVLNKLTLVALDEAIYHLTISDRNCQYIAFSVFCVVSDVRFENEAEAIRALNGDMVRVVRSNHANDSEVDSHRSEQLFPLVEGDITIVNDGETLEGLVDALVSGLIYPFPRDPAQFIDEVRETIL